MKKIYFVSLDAIEEYLSKQGKSWRGFRFETDIPDKTIKELAEKVFSVEEFCEQFNDCKLPDPYGYYARAL